MNIDTSKVARPLRWLIPGLGIKRWYALVFVGLLLAGLGAVLVFNLFAYELTAIVGGSRYAFSYGCLSIALGFAAVIFGVRGVINAIARTFLPAEEQRLVDVMISRRDAAVGLPCVVVGGGTGLGSLLRGLKRRTTNITAVATVSDEGGSSGRLREDMGVLPPGDLRSCLVALADSEPTMTRLFSHRFGQAAGPLSGHSFGNLFIAALTEITGDLEEAVVASSQIMAIRGRVLPPTLQNVTLCAKLRDGQSVRGELAVASAGGQQIERVYLDPPNPAAVPDVVEAIQQAQLVVLGPGSVFTSIVPNLLVPEVAAALVRTAAVRVLVCNVMTQPGETDSFGAVDHVEAIRRHVAERVFDYVLLNDTRPPAEVLARYEEEGAGFVAPAAQEIAKLGFIPVCRDLVSADSLARHDPEKLSDALLKIAAKHSGSFPI